MWLSVSSSNPQPRSPNPNPRSPGRPAKRGSEASLGAASCCGGTLGNSRPVLRRLVIRLLSTSRIIRRRCLMVDACSGRSRISELLDRACCVARAGFGQLDSGADGESEGNSPAGYIETGTSKPARIEGASYRAGLGKPHAHRQTPQTPRIHRVRGQRCSNLLGPTLHP